MRSRRGRDGSWRHGEAFGTSLADILTTALGCVLLLFLVAVLNVRHALVREQAAHGLTRDRLAAEAEGRTYAEQARDREQRAVEQEREAREGLERALTLEKGSRAEAERALRATEESKTGLAQQLAAATAQRELLQQRHGQLRAAAATVVSRLDPQATSPVDVMLVIDGTRSMKASLDAARRDLEGLVTALHVVSPSARVGVVVFRDRREADDFRLESHPLTDRTEQLLAFLAGIEASSTRVDDDLPEWLLGGMQTAMAAHWRDQAIKLMVVVSDAAAQDNARPQCEAAARQFAESGGRVFVLSTLPNGWQEGNEVAQAYAAVLAEHAGVAYAGGGAHVTGTGSDVLLHEVLKAALASQTRAPLEDLQRALDDTVAPPPPGP